MRVPAWNSQSLIITSGVDSKSLAQVMVFSPSRYVEIPNIDLLTWTFEGTEYDRDKDIYIDAIDDRRRLTYSQARSMVRKLISGFKSHGVKPGDSVLVNSFSDIMYPMLYLGIVGTGASFVGSNPSNTPEELSHIFSLTSVRYIITSPQHISNIMLSNSSLSDPVPVDNIFIFDTPHNPSVPPSFQSWQTLLQHGESTWVHFDDETSSKENIASLFSTSGTTGLFKIAAVSHHATIARCIASKCLIRQ
ncbi:hypothetical protein F5884DRAFT_812328 [Xylogone sp. PMI_703]|nr:hypothetical protein F5884DRAFT_812328 [Xylogone sp. PMI_703]